MGDKTSIGWTRGDDGSAGASWNPFRAEVLDPAAGPPRRGWFCEKVSGGCDHCYAEALNLFRGNALDYEANVFEIISEAPTEIRLRDKRRPESIVRLYLDVDTLLDPLRWQRARRIFPCSMTDYCLRFYPDAWIKALFGVAFLAPRHTFQFLTKRANRQRDILVELAAKTAPAAIAESISLLADLAPDHRKLIARETDKSLKAFLANRDPERFPPANAWIGVSIEDEKAFWRAGALNGTPAALRWWSVEPFVGRYTSEFRRRAVGLMKTAGVDWIVPGGESGTSPRSLYLDDLAQLIFDATEHDVPVFVKQLGAKPLFGDPPLRYGVTGKGEDVKEWPGPLVVQNFPEARR